MFQNLKIKTHVHKIHKEHRLRNVAHVAAYLEIADNKNKFINSVK